MNPIASEDRPVFFVRLEDLDRRDGVVMLALTPRSEGDLKSTSFDAGRLRTKPSSTNAKRSLKAFLSLVFYLQNAT